MLREYDCSSLRFGSYLGLESHEREKINQFGQSISLATLLGRKPTILVQSVQQFL